MPAPRTTQELAEAITTCATGWTTMTCEMIYGFHLNAHCAASGNGAMGKHDG